MTTMIPTMSSIGWIETVAKKADYVLACFITCQQSQSVLFAGKITSLQYLIKVNANKPVQLQQQTRDAFDSIMSAAFSADAVSVDVRVAVPDANKPAELSIQFNCTITIDGITYSVGKLVQAINSKITSIRTLNEG